MRDIQKEPEARCHGAVRREPVRPRQKGRIHCTGVAAAACILALSAVGCTQETQNRISRDIHNWTGTNGVL